MSVCSNVFLAGVCWSLCYLGFLLFFISSMLFGYYWYKFVGNLFIVAFWWVTRLAFCVFCGCLVVVADNWSFLYCLKVGLVHLFSIFPEIGSWHFVVFVPLWFCGNFALMFIFCDFGKTGTICLSCCGWGLPVFRQFQFWFCLAICFCSGLLLVFSVGEGKADSCCWGAAWMRGNCEDALRIYKACCGSAVSWIVLATRFGGSAAVLLGLFLFLLFVFADKEDITCCCWVAVWPRWSSEDSEVFSVNFGPLLCFFGLRLLLGIHVFLGSGTIGS